MNKEKNTLERKITVLSVYKRTTKVAVVLNDKNLVQLVFQFVKILHEYYRMTKKHILDNVK